jgi:hypothetical protein
VEDAAAAAAAEPAAEGAAPAAEAASGEEGMRMEGWLYLIRSNRFGLQYSRKRYFVLEDAALRCFKSAPSSKRQVTPARLPPRCSCVFFPSPLCFWRLCWICLAFCGGILGRFVPMGERVARSLLTLSTTLLTILFWCSNRNWDATSNEKLISVRYAAIRLRLMHADYVGELRVIDF